MIELPVFVAKKKDGFVCCCFGREELRECIAGGGEPISDIERPSAQWAGLLEVLEKINDPRGVSCKTNSEAIFREFCDHIAAAAFAAGKLEIPE